MKRIEEIMRETRCRIRVRGEIGQSFWTTRWARQGCPLSPLLFNILTANLEEGMRRVKWGGVRVGGEKLYTLSYADDIVLMAEDEAEMRSMMERLEGYLDRKGLELKTGSRRC